MDCMILVPFWSPSWTSSVRGQSRERRYGGVEPVAHDQHDDLVAGSGEDHVEETWHPSSRAISAMAGSRVTPPSDPGGATKRMPLAPVFYDGGRDRVGAVWSSAPVCAVTAGTTTGRLALPGCGSPGGDLGGGWASSGRLRDGGDVREDRDDRGCPGPRLRDLQAS